jgi:predicted GNAT family acetyltransferase
LNTVELATYTDPGAFLCDAQADLEQNETEHSLILGASLAYPAAPIYAATVRDSRGLVLAALRSASYPLLLASARSGAEAALPLLVKDLAGSDAEISAVVAPDLVADGFATRWSAATGQAASIGMRQRLHALTTVQPVSSAPGYLRVADANDLELITGWIAAFGEEALGKANLQHARGVAQRRIGAGEMYLWTDAEPSTMLGRARPTRHTIALNAVYTPRVLRGRGYATASVAALSALLLAEGYSQCVLFTDLANPTSNSIYARIGYRPVRDFTLWRFRPGPLVRDN